MEKIQRQFGGKKNMKYETIKINEIQPNNYNPNEMTEPMLNHLVKEIQRTGFLQPILINQNKLIIDGEHRWIAGKTTGLTEIPCIIVEMTDEQAKITTVNMNQIKGELNPIKFAELLKTLETNLSRDYISEVLNLTKAEIESNLALLTLPDYQNIPNLKPKEEEQIKCPQCGFTFNP
jgi:ParB/RepB/Spo0J family partition protein